jgi:hypothetical protein
VLREPTLIVSGVGRLPEQKRFSIGSGMREPTSDKNEMCRLPEQETKLNSSGMRDEEKGRRLNANQFMILSCHDSVGFRPARRRVTRECYASGAVSTKCCGSKTHERPVSIGLLRVCCHEIFMLRVRTSKRPNVYKGCCGVAGPGGGGMKAEGRIPKIEGCPKPDIQCPHAKDARVAKARRDRLRLAESSCVDLFKPIQTY